MNNKLMNLLKSFTCAIYGIKTAFKERNFKIHLLAAVSASAVAMYMNFSSTDLAILFIGIGSVLVAEAFNTAIEELTDQLRENKVLTYKQVGATKDIAAGAVLICATFAIIIGIILVLKYI